MLTAFIDFIDLFKYGLTGVFLFLDSIVYWLVSKLFSLYEVLAGAEIITQDTYQEIANKFYVIIGVVMLFYLAYSLLKMLINPDDFNKNFGKIAGNLIISLVLLGVSPIIFGYAFQIQNAIISDHVVDNLIFGVDETGNFSAENSIGTRGTGAAFNVLNAFLNPENIDISSDTMSWFQLKANVASGNPDAFFDLTRLIEPIHENKASYIPLISTLCGCFLIYVLISFCIDLGVRVVKLAFYQIIAPIPILMRIVPEKKSVFDNWIKACVATFMEVFVRMFIMYLVVYLVSLVVNGQVSLINTSLGFFANVFIILGLFAFAKQAPKLFSDVLGIDSGKIKLGIGGKLAANGAFGIAAMLGGGITTGVRNLTNRWGSFGNTWKDYKEGKSSLVKTLGSEVANSFRFLASGAAGTISGGVRGAKTGFSAKNMADVKKAAAQGAEGATLKRANREAYKAEHGNSIAGVVTGHMQDALSGFKSWATGSTEEILAKTKFADQISELFSDYEAIFKNPKYEAMEVELNKMKALKDTGAKTYEGQPIVDAIENLEGKMLESRMDSIRKNKQAASYAMYNIAQLANRNPAYAKDMDIDVSMANNLELKGGKIYDKKSGKSVDDIDVNQLFKMIEGSAVENITYDGKDFKTNDGSTLDFVKAARNQNDSSYKNGMRDQKKKAKDASKAYKISIDYKEAMKKKDANKK